MLDEGLGDVLRVCVLLQWHQQQSQLTIHYYYNVYVYTLNSSSV
jgi:hypothetical protein